VIIILVTRIIAKFTKKLSGKSLIKLSLASKSQRLFLNKIKCIISKAKEKLKRKNKEMRMVSTTDNIDPKNVLFATSKIFFE